jgi:hypothetical protein
LTSTQFAVGEDFEAKIFLALKRPQDVPVLDLAEAVGVQRSIVACFQNFLRTKKAADLVGSETGSGVI